MLDLVYLVESARYHMENLLRLTSGQGNAPSTFQAGVDFSGPELDQHWRVMASYTEFEAFLTTAKRFLDQAWCALGEEIGGDCTDIRTLGGILLRKDSKTREMREQLSQCEYFNCIKTIWNQWGTEVASTRNYAEHNSPFGGRSVGYIIDRQGREEIVLVLPDRIPESGESTPKDKLSYTSRRSATALVRQSMENIDRAMEQLVTAADLYRRQCRLRQSPKKRGRES